MHLPHFMRRVNRVFTNPVLGSIAWVLPPLAVLHHVGRKSGKAYRTPVATFATSTGFVVPMTYGRDVDWARNIVAAGGCEVERLGSRTAARNPRVVDSRVGAAHLPPLVRPLLRAAALPGYLLLDRGAAGRSATPSRKARRDR